MDVPEPQAIAAFAGTALIAQGDLADVARRTKQRLDSGESAPVVIFDAFTSHVVEIDFRGTIDDVLSRLPRSQPEAPGPRTPGRPRLGVVPREVTLLPRHWEWLAKQPGGASAALRKLVENALRHSGPEDRKREAQESTYRFSVTMAGNEAGFEEAMRALYSADAERFEEMSATWPADVRDHARNLAALAFSAVDE